MNVIGRIWDEEFVDLSPIFDPLLELDWDEYNEHLEQLHVLAVEFVTGAKKIEFEPFEHLSSILAEVPGIDRIYDAPPKDAGPAAGSGWIICVSEGFTENQVKDNMLRLVEAVQKDMDLLIDNS